MLSVATESIEEDNNFNSCDKLDDNEYIYIFFQFLDVYLLLNNNNKVFELSEQCLLVSLFLIIHWVNRLEQVSQKNFSNICFHENWINLISIIGL